MTRAPEKVLAPVAGPGGAGVSVDRSYDLERLVSAVLVVAVGAWHPVVGGLTVGTVVALALVPVLLPALRRFRGGPALVACWVLAIGSGLVLAVLARTEHTVLTHVMRDGAFHLLGVTLGVPAVLWARTRWSDASVTVMFGVGMLASAATSLSSVNPWKFSLSMPVAVVLLGVAWYLGRKSLEVLVLLVIAALCALNDSRSMFGVVLMTAVIVAWQAWRARTSRRGSAVLLLVLVTTLGAAAYQLGQALALEGALGTAAAERSARQIEQSGSMLVGSRPEMGATVALVRERPEGFGLGVLLRGEELRAAKEGMAGLGYDPDNGYVERYMFGRGVEVHSVVGDLWAWCGLAGVLLGVVLVVVVVRGLLVRLATRTASAVVVLLCLRVLWDLLFAPFASTMVFLTLVLGLLLVPRTGGAGDRDAEERDADARLMRA